MKIVETIKTKNHSNITNEYAEVTFLESASDTYIELEHNLPFEADGSEYVLFPACCYKGNQFDVMEKDYPPLFSDEEAKVDMPVVITDVPRLNKDGSGKIEVTTGDVSVPCVAIFSEKTKKAVFMFTIQEIDGINLGLSYEKGKIGITYPYMRKNGMYRWPHIVPSTDKGRDFKEGQKVTIPYKIYEIPCADLKEFYHFFFQNRKCMGLDDKLTFNPDLKKHYETHMNKMNNRNWNSFKNFYGAGIAVEGKSGFISGWGSVYTYAIMKLGGSLEWERGMQTVTQILNGVDDRSGLIYNFAAPDGEYKKGRTMIRKSGDVMYFILKIFNLMNERGVEIPEEWENNVKMMADAVVKIWNKYGQFGQWGDGETGDLVVGGSTAGAMIPGALALASKYYNNPEYLEVAKAGGEYMYKEYLEKGYTVGGPWEILQCPDSESSFSLIETYANLYKVTNDEHWIEYGKFAIESFSSWVMSYNYRFPESSEFYRLDMKTTGTVFANSQNKHSSPGICSFSGYSIYEFYQWTKDEKYLEMFNEITKTIKQFMSTDERPIYSWTLPANPMLLKEEERVYCEPEKLPDGFICERVNTSDWESDPCIGGVFNGSAIWCEAASLVTLADCQE